MVIPDLANICNKDSGLEVIHNQCLDHVISTGRQMTNLVSNFEYLLLLFLLTATKF